MKACQYDSFGNIVAETGTLENPFAYTGREWEPEFGLYYYRNRWYDPAIGRFISEDPIGFAAGDPNIFRYVFNNPVNFVDPWGLEIRIYSSDAFGIPGLNHAFVWSTEEQMGRGRKGIFGNTWGSGVGPLNSPYIVVTDLNGLSEKEFIQKIDDYLGWNQGPWIPWYDDCHSELNEAFEYAGVENPGAPNGRIDFDDIVNDIMRNVLGGLGF